MNKRVSDKDGTTPRVTARTGLGELALLLAPGESSSSSSSPSSPSSAMTDSRSARRYSLRNIVGICLLLALAGMLYLGYFCPDHVCALSTRDSKESTRYSESFLSGKILSLPLSLSHPLPLASARALFSFSSFRTHTIHTLSLSLYKYTSSVLSHSVILSFSLADPLFAIAMTFLSLSLSCL
jgi:hypothetical protein